MDIFVHQAPGVQEGHGDIVMKSSGAGRVMGAGCLKLCNVKQIPQLRTDLFLAGWGLGEALSQRWFP